MIFALPFTFVQAITQAFVDPSYISYPAHAYPGTKSYISTCGVGSTEPDITFTITKHSFISVADAENLAETEAINKAVAVRAMHPCPIF